MLKRLYKDPLIRRFTLASLLAAAFVWVAVDAYDVPTDVILEFFLYSIFLIVVMIALAFCVAVVLGRFRKRTNPFEPIEESSEDDQH